MPERSHNSLVREQWDLLRSIVRMASEDEAANTVEYDRKFRLLTRNSNRRLFGARNAECK